jgi:hypothetical protein
MIRSYPMVWLMLLPGCDLFQGVKDTVEGITNRNVAIGVVTTLEASADDLDLSETEFAPGVAATLFLADAASVTDLDNAPITGADVVLMGCGDEASMPESSQAGAYLYTPPGDLGPCMGPQFEMQQVNLEEPISLPVAIPNGGRLDVPLRHDAGEDLVLDLTASGYGAVLVLVFDTSNGDLTYSNEPETIGEYYQFLTTSDDVTTITVPGSAFKPDTVHALGITGLERTPNRELDNANEVLSVIAGGRTEVYPVSTLALDTDG